MISIQNKRRIGQTVKHTYHAVFIMVACLLAMSWSNAHAQESVKQVYVVNTGDGTVSQVDLISMKETGKHRVGDDPYGIALLPDGSAAAVGVEGESKVKFFDTKTWTVKGEVPLGKMFHDHIMLTKDGKYILVASYGNDALIAIDPITMKEAFRVDGLSGPHVAKYGPTRSKIYVTCKKITGIAAVDLDDGNKVTFWPLNVNPRSLTFSPDESKLYFGSFWVDGFFELDTKTGKVTNLFTVKPPADNNAPQEVTYHGVESVGSHLTATANEGRSCIDLVDTENGKLLSRLNISKPCCLEKLPDQNKSNRLLISGTGDGTVELVEVTTSNELKSLGKVKVGAAPKRVAFLTTANPMGD